MLAVFSLPTGAGALNLRQGAVHLKETIRSIARTAGRAIDLRVLQYGVTREALKSILKEGEGWDLIHFSGHGLASQLVLEKADGTRDSVDVPALIELLKPSRRRLKWVTLSACWSGAATVAETMRWLGLEPHRDERDLDSKDPNPRSTGPRSGRGSRGKDRPKFTSVASALVRELDCAVLAMRYPVGDEFAIALANTMYRGVSNRARICPGPATRPARDDRGPVAALRGHPGPVRVSGGRPEVRCARTPGRLDVRAVGRVDRVPAATQALRRPGRRDGEGWRGPGAGAAGPAYSSTACRGGRVSLRVELAYQYEDLKRFTGFVWYEAPEGSEVAGSLAAFATAFETQLSDENLKPRSRGRPGRGRGGQIRRLPTPAPRVPHEAERAAGPGQPGDPAPPRRRLDRPAVGQGRRDAAGPRGR